MSRIFLENGERRLDCPTCGGLDLAYMSVPQLENYAAELNTILEDRRIKDLKLELDTLDEREQNLVLQFVIALKNQRPPVIKN